MDFCMEMLGNIRHQTNERTGHLESITDSFGDVVQWMVWGGVGQAWAEEEFAFVFVAEKAERIADLIIAHVPMKDLVKDRNHCLWVLRGDV